MKITKKKPQNQAFIGITSNLITSVITGKKNCLIPQLPPKLSS